MKKLLQTIHKKKLYVSAAFIAMYTSLFSISASASGVGDKAVEAFNENVYGQIKTAVSGIVLPIANLSLVVALIVKIAGACKSYHERGQIEWTPIVIIFVCLCVTVTANLWMWGLIGG